MFRVKIFCFDSYFRPENVIWLWISGQSSISNFKIYTRFESRYDDVYTANDTAFVRPSFLLLFFFLNTRKDASFRCCNEMCRWNQPNLVDVRSHRHTNKKFEMSVADSDGDGDDMRRESHVRVVQWPEVINVRFLHGREDLEGDLHSSFYPSTPSRSDISIFRLYRTKTPSVRHYPRMAIAVMNCPKRFHLRNDGQRNPVSKHPSHAHTYTHPGTRINTPPYIAPKRTSEKARRV